MALPEIIKDIEARVKDTGDALTGTLTWPGNIVALNFRTGHSSFDGTVTYQTAGNEALVFGTKNLVTSFIFVNGEDTITNNASDRWYSLTTPGLQIKNNCVSIGELWGNTIDPNYKFRVTGTSYLNGPVTIEGALTANDTITAIGNITAPTFVGALQGNATSASSLKSSSHLTTIDAMNNFVYANEVKFATFKLDADSNGLGFGANDGMLLSIPWTSTTYAVQLAVDDAGRKMSIRSKSTTWSDWTRVLTSDNYTDYTVTKTGVGASGTWGISISGNAATATKATQDGSGNDISSTYVKHRENGTSYTQMGSYYNGGSTAGYVRIALPVYSGWDMCQMEFTIRQTYGSGTYGKLTLYAHTSGSTSNWVQFYAVYHDRLTSAIKVYGSDNRYFYIAGISAWGGLTLDKVVFGDGVTGADMSAIVIDGVSELPATYQTATMLRSWTQGDSVTGAVWNDYAECREADTIEPGYVLVETGDDTLTKSTERLSPFAGVSSDTWGFSQGETNKAKTPIAVAGRVLVYPWQDRNNYKPGDCVCAAPDGKVDIMTREEVIQYPDRIVGTVSSVPTYDKWGGGETADREPVDVDGRIWIKVR